MAKQSTTTRKQAASARPKRRKAEAAPSQNGQDVSSFEQELAEYLQERIKPGLNSGAIPLLARSIAKDIARRAEDAQSGGDDEDGNSAEEEADDDQAQAQANDADVEDTEDVEDVEDDDTEAEADDAEAEADDDTEAEADDDTEAEADDEYDDDEAGDETEAAADDDYEDDEGDDEAESNGNGSTDFEADMRELQGEFGDDWILRFSVQGDESWLTAEKDDGSQRVQASSASVLSEVVELLNDDG